MTEKQLLQLVMDYRREQEHNPTHILLTVKQLRAFSASFYGADKVMVDKPLMATFFVEESCKVDLIAVDQKGFTHGNVPFPIALKLETK